MNKNKKQAFTLLEILLAVAALVILASIVILALNPGKQLADTRNSQRWVDVNTILNAVYQYSIDNSGDLPAGITGTDACIKSGAATDCTVTLSELTLNEEYLVALPSDPKAVADDNYTIATTTGGRIIIKAPLAERGATIEVSR